MENTFLKKMMAGLFVLVSLLLFVGAIFLLGTERGLTEPKFSMEVLFTRVGGLAVGAPVRLSGVTVGTVTDIDFLSRDIQGREVKVRLGLLKKYEHQVTKTVKVSIITEGVLGEKVIEITTDPDQNWTDFHQPLIGVDPLDVQTLAETFGESATTLRDTSHQIDRMMAEMHDIAISVRRLLQRIEQRVIDGNLFKVF